MGAVNSVDLRMLLNISMFQKETSIWRTFWEQMEPCTWIWECCRVHLYRHISSRSMQNRVKCVKGQMMQIRFVVSNSQPYATKCFSEILSESISLTFNFTQHITEYRSETEPYVAITRTTYPITLPTTPTTGPPNVSYSPQPNFSLTTQLHRIFPTNVGFPGHENNSATNLGEGNRNQESNHVIVWISLAAAAIVFTLVGCGILFTQRYSNVFQCHSNFGHNS